MFSFLRRLLAFAATRPATAAVDQHFRPARRSAANPTHACGRMMGQTDGRTLGRFTDTAARTTQARSVPVRTRFPVRYFQLADKM